MTRNASEFLLKSVACREYTLPRDDPASEAKGWIQGNTRIGPILEVTTTFQHFKFGVEVRIQSVKEDNSQSWVARGMGSPRHAQNRRRGGLARVPNLRVSQHLLTEGWHTQGGKDELTSCRGTV